MTEQGEASSHTPLSKFDISFCRHFELNAANHPVLQQHFPGNPIVPAYLVLSFVTECIKDEYLLEGASLRIKHAKFIHPITPSMKGSGDAISMRAASAESEKSKLVCSFSIVLNKTPKGLIAFKVISQEVVCAHGEIYGGI